MRAGTRSREVIEREADHYADYVLNTCQWWERVNDRYFGNHEPAIVIDGSLGGRRLGQPTVSASDVLDWEPVAMANLIEAASRAEPFDELAALRKAKRAEERVKRAKGLEIQRRTRYLHNQILHALDSRKATMTPWAYEDFLIAMGRIAWSDIPKALGITEVGVK